jgi:hypothetical protein
MARSIIGVIVGYVVMFILHVAAFMTIYTVMGPDWSFKPASYQASTRWIVTGFAVILIAGIIAGLVCALIAKGGKAPMVLAGVILVLGLALTAVARSKRSVDAHELRSGNVPNMEAMSKAQNPTWVIFLGPVISAVGAAIGGKLKRSN